MIYVNDKEWNKLEDKEKISYCDSLLEDAKRGREKRDLEWYLNHMFLEGNHYLSINTTTDELVPLPVKNRGEVRMVVNKTRSGIRAVQNYVTRERPKWDVVPGDLDDQTVVNARRTGKVMDYIYRKLHLEQMVAGVIESGLNTSVGWVEVDWDSDAEGGVGQVRIRHHDSFDVWVDRRASLYAGKLQSAFVAKTPIKSVAEVKADERYDKKARKDVKPDEELAASRMKAKIIRRDGSTEDEKIERVMVKEFMLWDDEKNDKGGRIKLFTYAGDKILREEDLEDMEYPLYLYQISMSPLRIYQRAWTSDAIPLNKALDRAISQQIMYINQALVYRIIAEKGHGINTFSNEMGEVIEVNKGREFQQMDMNPLPGGYDALITQLGIHIEDVLGAHEAALGRLPTGARSGDTLEALQAADSNNLAGLTSSLESFLAVVGERILKLVAKHYTVSRVVKIAEPEEGKEYMKVIGEGAENVPEDSTVITEDNELIVRIGSWLGHSKEAQRKTILEMAQMGFLPAEEVLRQFEFPNVEELSSKARDQRLERDQMQLAIAGHAGGGASGEEGIDMVALAEKESTDMLNGQEIPPTEGANPDHSQVHRDVINSRTFKSAPPEYQQLLINHYQGEVGPLGAI